MDNIHKGHRERLRTRFVENGLKAFSDVEALELLLFYAQPRCNTNETAHRLLERFGSYGGVLEANLDELKKVKGIGDNAAVLIRLLRELNRRYLTGLSSEDGKLIGSSDAAADYIWPLFSYATEEQAYAITVNSAGRMIRCWELGSGLSNGVEFSARRVVEAAIKDNAAYVILAHNHLSGEALPSRADIVATRQIWATLRDVGVTLADHMIVSGRSYTSMKDTGIFKEF